MQSPAAAARFRQPRHGVWPPWIIALLVLCEPSPANASPLIELTGGTLGIGGFNARAGGASAASTYFNPALLPRAAQGLEVGVLVLNDAISITLDGRDPSVDVPVTNLSSLRTMYPVPTVWLERGCMGGSELKCITDIEAQPRQSEGSSGNTRPYMVIGLVSDLVKDRWTLAMFTIVPFGSLISAHSFLPDEREQYITNSLHAELYSDRLTPMSLAFGTGLRIVDWLSVGVSFTLNLSNSADASTFVGRANNLDDTLVLSTQFDAAIGVAPHFALLVEPIEPLHVSVTVHTVQQLEIVANSGTYIGTGDSQVARRSAVHDWLPLTLALGVAFDVYDSGPHLFSVVGSATFKQWSEYLNRHGERPLPGYEWGNTVSGAAGARYANAGGLATFLDVNYEPSPVPLQTGRTNYVDNDRFGATAGIDYTLPVEDWGVKFRFGVQGQLHLLRERHQNKVDPRTATNDESLVIDEWPDDTAINPITQQPFPEGLSLQTNNPGWPGFSSEGTIVGGMLSVGLLY